MVQATPLTESLLLPANSCLQHYLVDGSIDLYARDFTSADTVMHALCFNSASLNTSTQAPCPRQQCTLALLCTDAIIVQLESLDTPSQVLQTLFAVHNMPLPVQPWWTLLCLLHLCFAQRALYAYINMTCRRHCAWPRVQAGSTGAVSSCFLQQAQQL